MDDLKPEIIDGLSMFKPKSLKEASSLVRMRDEQLNHKRRATQLVNRPIVDY